MQSAGNGTVRGGANGRGRRSGVESGHPNADAKIGTPLTTTRRTRALETVLELRRATDEIAAPSVGATIVLVFES
jgi:hypothetical protein